MRLPLSEPVRIGTRLAFAHHPLCHWFRDDRFGPVCSGCAVFWPMFLLTTPAATVALVFGTSAWALLLASFVLGAPQLLTAVFRFGRLARAAIKLLGGAAVATAVLSIAWLPVAWPGRAALYALMAASFGVLLALRVRSILRTCHACPWQRDWEHCPGFRDTPGWQRVARSEGPTAVPLEARADS